MKVATLTWEGGYVLSITNSKGIVDYSALLWTLHAAALLPGFLTLHSPRFCDSQLRGSAAHNLAA